MKSAWRLAHTPPCTPVWLWCGTVVMCWLVTSLSSRAAAATNDHLYRPEFRVFWNVPTFGCHRYGLTFNLSAAWGLEQNAKDSFRGERLAILYDPGDFPALVADSTGRLIPRNGGTPQEGDLNRHLAALARDVDRLVPDINFSGLGVVDMESWRPVWRQLFGSFLPYKPFSREIERRRHPTWTPNQIEDEARRRFEESAKVFMETSLELVRQLRPRALWGYYAFPYCFNTHPQSCTTETRHENDRMQWLFSESGALFPSVYLGAQKPAPSDRGAFIRARLTEAQRMATSATRLRGPRIYAYVRYNYYDTSQFLSPEALHISLSTPKNMNIDGVVIWGSWNDVQTKSKCEDLQNYVDTVLGPMVKNLTDVVNDP